VPERKRAIAFADFLDQHQHHAEDVLGDRLGVAAGLIDDQDAAFGAGFQIDGVVAGAVGRHQQQVRRVFEEIRAGVVVPRQLLAGGAGLIGMRGGQNRLSR
jgi:hypothetical protein